MVCERIRVRKAVRAAARLRKAGETAKALAVLSQAGVQRERQGAQVGTIADASWLTSLAACTTPEAVHACSVLSLDEYLTLLDATGRLLRDGKRGAIPARLAPILARLELDIDRWVACMRGFRQFIGSAVGRLASRGAEATRRGLRWVQNRCALFAGEATAAS